MELRLSNLSLENFKGIRQFSAELDGQDATVCAANGVGKTSLYDAFLWLLFGKDSTGRTQFEVRPLDDDNQPIKGLVVAVQADIECDGVIHTFRKEQKERIVKGQHRGYTTSTWINEVPKKEGQYTEAIAGLVSEDHFRLLTNLRHFCEGIKWQDRRVMLLEVAGEISTPEGFDELVAALNGRTVDEYRQVLTAQKKKHTEKRDEITPRIDELQRAHEAHVGEDTAGLEKVRAQVQAVIDEIDEERKALLASERQRAQRLEQVGQLKVDRAAREAVLRTEAAAGSGYYQEKADLDAAVEKARAAVSQIELARQLKDRTRDGRRSTMEDLLRRRQAVREDYQALSSTGVEGACRLCGQSLPAEKLAEAQKRHKEGLEEVIGRGNEIQHNIKACQAQIETLQAEIARIAEEQMKAKQALADAEASRTKRLAELEAAKTNQQAPDYTQDATWKRITAEIFAVMEEVGEPVYKQLEALDAARERRAQEIDELNRTLAQSDRIEADAQRIAELQAEEKKLAQAMADVDRLLAMIDGYKAAESRQIEAAVNDRFTRVQFKLFKQLLNGSVEDCCEVLFNGVPYSDLSTGQQIYSGIDVVNVLSEHLGTRVPLFIDHAESVTLPMETTSQTIRLYARAGVNQLTVATKGETANV